MSVAPNMSDDKYLILHPRKPIPGCLVTIGQLSGLEAIKKLEQNPQPRRYIVRAIISDQIPLTGGIEEVMNLQPVRLLRLNENPLTIYLHHGGDNAVFYDLCPDSKGFLSHIDVEAEANLPGNAFAPARTAFNNLLDSMTNMVWIPLAVSRLELYLKGENVPLAHELLLTFQQRLEFGPLGGLHSYPLFDPHESLIREAVNSTSPFYRFMCAYRLYEGVNPLRHSIREICRKLSVADKLPSDPVVDIALLEQMGFTKEFLKSVHTVGDLHNKLTETRNRIAHFLLKSDKYVVNTSNGFHYVEYSLGGAVLLFYSHQALADLRNFYSKHLIPLTSRGQILPLKEYGDKFIIRT